MELFRYGWAVLALGLVGCGSGSPDAEPVSETGASTAEADPVDPQRPDGLGMRAPDEPVSSAPLGEPTRPPAEPESGGAGLTFVLDPGCTVPEQPVSLRLRARETELGIDDDSDERRQFGRNVTGFTDFQVDEDTALSLLSRDDEAVNVAFTQAAQVTVTAVFGGRSVTRFLSAFPADAPDSAVLRTRVEGGCIVSLRLPDYCGTARSRGAELRLGSGEDTLTGTGCELDNPNGYPVIDLP